MNQLKKSGFVGIEDLMRELNHLEQDIMKTDGSLAMELMVLETKIRDRFNFVQKNSADSLNEDPIFNEDLTFDEIKAMIPQDLGPFPTLEEVESFEKKKRVAQNVMWAGILAVVTALGVFGLASTIQLVLTWFA